MKKWIKRIINCIMTILLVVSMVGVMPMKKVEASQSQVDAIINFAKSQLYSASYDKRCQAFVKACYEAAGIYSSTSPGTATEAKKLWGVSSDLSNIPIGACLYFKQNHVAIYVGDGQMIGTMSGGYGDPNVSYVRMTPIADFIGQIECWGYQAGYDLYATPITSEFPLVDGGIYKIRNVNSGKLIDIPGGTSENGSPLWQWDDGGVAHEFVAIRKSDGYVFQSVQTNYVLDIKDGSAATGVALTQATFNDSAAQHFKLVHRGNGQYSIHPACSELALDVYGSSLDNGEAIKQYAYHGRGNQLWTFEYIDRTAPAISDIQITQLDRNGYKVTCTVADAGGVAKVCFPTWTEANGQDDLFANWQDTAVGSCDGGNTYSYRVNIWDHNNEGGRYITRIYAYDNAGNSSMEQVVADVVRDIPLEGFSLNYGALSLNINQIQSLCVQSYVPADTTSDRTATWTSSDPSVASVDAQGAVRGLKQGSATITCTVAGKTQTCQVTVSDYVEQEYSGWVDSLPSEVSGNPGLYQVEQKTQYRSRTRSETVSTTPDLAGWTCSDQWWGDWQSCGADVTGSATREVKNEQQYVKTQYFYNHWHNRSNGATSPVQYSGWTYEETGWLDSALTASGTSSAGGTKYTSGTALGSCGLKWFWYNQQTRDVYNTLYYYRDKYFRYYQWSDWTNWTDQAVGATDTVAVETRTIYRYRFVGPQIMAQPAAQTGDVGGKAYFAVEANGQQLSYQWQVSTDGGKTWKNSGMTGNQTAKLTVDIYAARDGYCFRCVVKDAYGNEVVSGSAQLTVNLPAVRLTAQPKGQSADTGKTVTFSVTADGTGLTYQWQASTDGGKTWKNSGMTGNKTAALKVEATESRNGYQFRCVVTDKRANTVVSDAAKLTVIGNAKITGQPKSQSAEVGKTVKFTVTATGSGLKYQWQASTDGGKTWKNSGMTGNKTATLAAEATESRNGYQFRCIVTDSKANSVTSNAAKLTVIGNAKITGQPKSQSAEIGKTVKFTVTATGSGLKYQWQASTDGGKTWKNSGMTGNKTATLIAEVTASRNGYQFRCIVTDSKANSVTSGIATLTVESDAAITAQPKDQTMDVGAIAAFTVTATGSGLKYQWQASTDGGKTWKNSGLTGNQTATLKVAVTADRNGYQFRCIVTDSKANSVTSNTAKLVVNGSLKITGQPQKQSAAAGETASFHVEAAGAGLTYQWQASTDGGKTWKNSGLTGNKTATLKVEATASRNGYQFRCKVTDAQGKSVTTTAAQLEVAAASQTLQLLPAPTLQQPASVSGGDAQPENAGSSNTQSQSVSGGDAQSE